MGSELVVMQQPLPRCPFYGCSLHKGFDEGPLLVGSGGNQCALVTRSFSPCRMEIRLETPPDWNECPLSKEPRNIVHAEQLRANARILPRGLSKADKVIPFDLWWTKCMGAPVIARPKP